MVINDLGTFRFTPKEDDIEFDHLLWDQYIETYLDDNFDGYFEFIKNTVPGIVEVGQGDDLGTTIQYIDFESEKYYTMFILSWT